jgi:membrane associated rhomboid family serine protease/Flp pilus assembly protein TadD
LAQCAQCGCELTAAESGSVCGSCHLPAVSVSAEESAVGEQHFPITSLLLAINIVVFVAMLVNHVPLVSPTSEHVVRWGGNFGPLTLGGQPWRLFTNIFVHIGLPHIVANMWALLVLGRLAEQLYGRRSFLAIYLISGLGGSLASLCWNPIGVSAGASGALFGIAGALIATLYAGKLPLPKQVIRPILWTLLFWAAFDLAYGFWKAGVDNAAHVGGFIAGLMVGYPIGHRLSSDASARRFRRRILAGASLLLAAASMVIWRVQGYVVDVERARVMLTQNHPDQAIALLQPALDRHPKEALLHVLLAEALERKDDFSGGEREFKQALDFAPNNAAIWRNLGGLYVRMQRWADAAGAYTKSATLSKDGGLAWYNAGVAYLHSDRPQEAADSLRKCLAVNPYFGEAWYQLGIALLNLKQNNEAINALRQATRLLPNSPDVHLGLGNALLAAGQEDAARTEMLRAYRLRLLQQRALQQLQQQPRKHQPQLQPAPQK